MPVLSDNKEPIDGDRVSYQVNNFWLGKNHFYLSRAKVLCMAAYSLCQLPMHAIIFSSSLDLLNRKMVAMVCSFKLQNLTCSLISHVLLTECITLVLPMV